MGQLVCNSNRWRGRYLHVSQSYFVKSSILLFKEKQRREKRKEKRKQRKERKRKKDDQIPARVWSQFKGVQPSATPRRLGISGQQSGCWLRVLHGGAALALPLALAQARSRQLVATGLAEALRRLFRSIRLSIHPSKKVLAAIWPCLPACPQPSLALDSDEAGR